MNIALIDYEAGNIHSAHKALEVAARQAGVDMTVTIGSDPEVVAAADRIVLPGDGAFADCVNHLRSVPGLSDALHDSVQVRGKPFFGICVGMQLLATKGLEHGATAGLDWLPGTVKRIEPADATLKVPHMGWNTLFAHREHPLLKGLALGPDGLHAYFLHAYHLIPANDDDVLADADYGGPITAIVTRGNIVGTQFHPEKSQTLGLKLLANFLTWMP